MVRRATDRPGVLRRRLLRSAVALVAVGALSSTLVIASAEAASGDPSGALDAVSPAPGGIALSGWAIDPDTTAPIRVDVYADGTGIGRITAKLGRSDLASIFPAYGGDHGYSTTLHLGQGTHNVCAYAINVGAGTNNPILGCKTVTLSNNPGGFLDAVTKTATGIAVGGWTIDPDTTGPVSVDIYADGFGLGRLTANRFRPDIAPAYPAYGGSHGFSGALALGQGPHNVCAYALNIGLGTSNPALGCKIITLQYNPIGFLDTVSTTATGIIVSGWSLDPDTASPINVDIYADGIGLGRLTANLARPDIASIFPAYGGSHGFSGALALGQGPHKVCAYAVNVGLGTSNPVLGCKTIALHFDPIGVYDAITRPADNRLTVYGWGFDPSTVNPILVSVSIDGAAGSAALAAISRPDVGAAYPGAGSNHGFADTLPTSNGEHTVCVTALNVGLGHNTSLGCKILNAAHPVVPSAPRNVVAVGGYGGATVSWSAPASDGGAPPTFTVTASPGGRTATAVAGATGAIVSGLAPSTTYAFSVVATNVAGPSAAGVSNHVTTRALPSAQTTAAPVSTSRYIRNISGAAGDPATLRAEGAADAGANPSGHSYMILLDIGGQTQSGGGVLLSAIARYVSYANLVSSLDAYVDGYASAQKPSAAAMIALGTNNDSDVNATTGAIWATSVVNPVAAHSAGYSGITIAGADDIEPGFSANVASSRAWLSGYLGATGAPFVFNGSADGCSWTAINGSCNNGWTAADLYWLSGGAAPARSISLPQIYNNTMPKQWKYISLTGVASGQSRIYFGGPLTELTACQQAGSCSSLGGNDAWNALWGQLNSDARLAPGTLPYSTDLRVN